MGTRGMQMENEKGSTMRNFVVCSIHVNIISVIKFRSLRWTGHVARIE